MIILLLAWALDEFNAKVKKASWKPTNNRKPAGVVFKWEVLSELHENGNTDVQCKIWNWWKTIFNGHCKKEKRLKNLQTKRILQWKRNERNKTCLEMCPLIYEFKSIHMIWVIFSMNHSFKWRYDELHHLDCDARISCTRTKFPTNGYEWMYVRERELDWDWQRNEKERKNEKKPFTHLLIT